ncbi:MAG: F0F1 ATP synthase subunit delta [Gammaproteobacteria bacterium]
MQEKITLARPYAIAAFEQARDEGDLGAWSEMLNVLSLVVSDPQMQPVLNNPRLAASFLSDLIQDICSEYLSQTGRNFVKLLADNGRLILAPQIYQLYEQSRTEAEGIVEVEVVSAYSLEGDEVEKITDALARHFEKKINISTRIDESLIGGAVIHAGDSVIDASLKGRLKQLSSELAE